MLTRDWIMTQKDWIYDLYVKERLKSKDQVTKSINRADQKDLPKNPNNGKSKSDR